MGRYTNWLSEIGNDDEFWADEYMRTSSFPLPIVLEYENLRNLAKAGNVYGCLLQIKDLYEVIIKIPVMMAWVIAEKKGDHTSEMYPELLKRFLGKQLSMGDWNTIAGLFVDSAGVFCLPDDLTELLKQTRDLFRKPIADKENIVKWRNTEIGHGALRVEDDEDYQEEIAVILEFLRKYFTGRNKAVFVKDYYDDLYFEQDGRRICGNSEQPSEGELVLVAGGERFDTVPQILFGENITNFFDSYRWDKSITRYLDYISGKERYVKEPFFQTLYYRWDVSARSERDLTEAEFISRGEEAQLDQMVIDRTDYKKPKYITNKIKDALEELGKGVITVRMERGTGKTALASRLNGLYYGFKDLLIKSAEIRVYHIGNSSTGDVNDFVSAFNTIFKRNFNHQKDIREIRGSVDISAESETPSSDLAAALGTYHREYGRDHTILVVDGIDELTSRNSGILDFIPAAEQLEEGCFVMLMTRFEDEPGVSSASAKYVRKAVGLAESSGRLLSFRRDTEENRELLGRYIDSVGTVHTDAEKNKIIEKADCRFLYVKILTAVAEGMDWDMKDEREVMDRYISFLSDIYGKRFSHELNKILAVIALTGSFTYGMYREFFRGDFSAKTLGIMNDIMPLLSVERTEDGNEFRFANECYYRYVRDLLKVEIKAQSEVFFEEGESLTASDSEEGPVMPTVDISAVTQADEIRAASKFRAIILNILSRILTFAEEEGEEVWFYSNDLMEILSIFLYVRLDQNTSGNVREMADMLAKRMFPVFLNAVRKGAKIKAIYYYENFFDKTILSGASEDLFRPLLNVLSTAQNKRTLIYTLTFFLPASLCEEYSSAVAKAGSQDLAAECLWEYWCSICQFDEYSTTEMDYSFEAYCSGEKLIRLYGLAGILLTDNLDADTLTGLNKSRLASLQLLTGLLIFCEYEAAQDVLLKMESEGIAITWPGEQMRDDDLIDALRDGCADILVEERKEAMESQRSIEKDDKIIANVEIILEDIKNNNFDNTDKIDTNTLIGIVSSHRDLLEGRAAEILARRKEQLLNKFLENRGEYSFFGAERKLYITLILDPSISESDVALALLYEYCRYYAGRKALFGYTSSTEGMGECLAEDDFSLLYCSRETTYLLQWLIEQGKNEEAMQLTEAINRTIAKLDNMLSEESFGLDHLSRSIIKRHLPRCSRYYAMCVRFGILGPGKGSEKILNQADMFRQRLISLIESADEYTSDDILQEYIHMTLSHYYYTGRYEHGSAVCLEMLKTIQKRKEQGGPAASLLDKVATLLELYKRIFDYLSIGNREHLDITDDLRMHKDEFHDDSFYYFKDLLITQGPYVSDEFYGCICTLLTDIAEGELKEPSGYRFRVSAPRNIGQGSVSDIALYM